MSGTNPNRFRADRDRSSDKRSTNWPMVWLLSISLVAFLFISLSFLPVNIKSRVVGALELSLLSEVEYKNVLDKSKAIIERSRRIDLYLSRLEEDRDANIQIIIGEIQRENKSLQDDARSICLILVSYTSDAAQPTKPKKCD